MKNELVGYLTAVSTFENLLINGIIDTDAMLQIDTILAEKYKISSCSIYRWNPLIYQALRGNMSH